ncbi:hypothetical protein DACRYDRAFT_76878 [Dacryopinax primogenitus]|uniref:Autophagy-related protein 3 n=1 Tax=Dacryopinax primogenitus (strain DJM 731) TaxID=1858805 RepID=M5GFU0_DACPD|nr:uncharacterized protein DACRYDRAFT_76878 [Dacryopinax primogenitus]EJU04428.1 hypothetical protein DACRYDRAFT_76878 [Dacryopinax primogenitus]
MHAVQTQFWAVRDYLSPVLRESKFKEHGRITPEEFVAAGDFLTYKFPVWTWEKGDGTRVRDFLPKDKQFLMTRNVPCLRRATTLAYTDEQEDAEKMLSFTDGGDKEDEWVQTHAGRAGEGDGVAEISDIPDLDGPSHTASAITAGLNKMTMDERHAIDAQPIPEEIPDIDDIPDMEDEGLEEAEDVAAAAPEKAAVTEEAQPIEVAKDNLLQVRTYDVMITYDKYYQTPRIWLLGYDESGNPLTPSHVFQDVSADHAFKTVTIEPFPHSTTLTAASVHPCKHANVMKKVIERMNAGIIAEEQKRLGISNAKPDKDGKSGRRWLGGMVRRVTGGSGTESPSTGSETPASEDAEGMRVDFYLVVFLKFIASIVPTIEVDSTTAF